MKNITVLPADTYTVINKTIISEKDKKFQKSAAKHQGTVKNTLQKGEKLWKES